MTKGLFVRIFNGNLDFSVHCLRAIDGKSGNLTKFLQNFAETSVA
jgi:hypothetical protein